MIGDLGSRDGLLASVIGGLSALIGDVVIYGGDLIASALFTLLLDVGSWFPILTIVSSYVAPEVPAIPEGTMRTVVALAATLYAAVLIGRYIDSKT